MSVIKDRHRMKRNYCVSYWIDLTENFVPIKVRSTIYEEVKTFLRIMFFIFVYYFDTKLVSLKFI